MPYDPALPAPHSPLESQVIRDQLQALFALIQQALSVTGAQVDGVNTLPPGSPAGVSVGFAAGVLHFTFDLPQGAAGTDGTPGTIVSGAQVDGVGTLDPGQSATAGVVFDGATLRFTFGIPRGADGAPAPPPEVTQATLNTAIGGTSSNSNGVGTLDTPFADADDETLRGKLNELLIALRR